MTKVQAVEAVVRDEPIIASRPYSGDPSKGVELQIGTSGLLARIRYKPDKFPGVEGVNKYLESCPICQSIEEVLARTWGVKPLEKIERETAEKMLASLAFKYGVPKPKLVLAESCSDPRFGVYQENGPIVMCRGGLNARVLAHEFKHYLDKVQGRPISESEAEKFVLKETRGKDKVLYCEKSNHKFGEVKTVVTASDILKYWGPQHLAKGVERGFVEVDRITGRAALPPHERPSFWGNIGMTVAGALGALFLPSPLDLVLAVWGGHHSTTLWDYAEEYVAGGAGRVAYRPAGGQRQTEGAGAKARYVVKGSTSATRGATTQGGGATQGRYRVTG